MAPGRAAQRMLQPPPPPRRPLLHGPPSSRRRDAAMNGWPPCPPLLATAHWSGPYWMSPARLPTMWPHSSGSFLSCSWNTNPRCHPLRLWWIQELMTDSCLCPHDSLFISDRVSHFYTCSNLFTVPFILIEDDDLKGDLRTNFWALGSTKITETKRRHEGITSQLSSSHLVMLQFHMYNSIFRKCLELTKKWRNLFSCKIVTLFKPVKLDIIPGICLQGRFGHFNLLPILRSLSHRIFHLVLPSVCGVPNTVIDVVNCTHNHSPAWMEVIYKFVVPHRGCWTKSDHVVDDVPRQAHSDSDPEEQPVQGKHSDVDSEISNTSSKEATERTSNPSSTSTAKGKARRMGFQLQRRAFMAVTVTKEVGRGWDPKYTHTSFFPYWRSVLVARFPMKVYPAYAKADARSRLDLEHLSVPRSKSLANGLVGRISPLASNHQPKRALSTAAISAFRLLKMLKYA
ncbi:unnamed protein product [Miscanthus lutarioriparius]|uniref:Uncharacterized protein n=1 Tax=Miscanthus lutarioriparius TaxID=422564 RepID=A0A811NP52_9POAL|nr:unnamed protein product [Miscanthus lutarioriparius]